jgi:hypothetical protein
MREWEASHSKRKEKLLDKIEIINNSAEEILVNPTETKEGKCIIEVTKI